MNDIKFHHLGVAVKTIEGASPFYKNLGYSVSETVIEPIQKVKVAYARKEGMPTIELLEPLNEESPINNILTKNGCTPYHICYSVKDINQAISDLRSQGFMPLGKPIPGHGLDDAVMVFMYNANVGLIQLVEI